MDFYIRLTIPSDLIRHPEVIEEYRMFFQAAANRRGVGSLRYEATGKPTRGKKYLTRLRKEVNAYKRTGNIEHLFNAVNYAFLESYAPEHPHQRWDAAVESVTRSEMGGDVERGRNTQ